MTKIVDLTGTPIERPDPKINPELLSLLRFITERVLKGDVAGLLITVITEDHNSERAWAGLDIIPVSCPIGALELFKNQLTMLALNPDMQVDTPWDGPEDAS